MQRADQLQLADQRPEFGGGSKLKFCSLVDVKRLVPVIGLNAQVVYLGASLVKVEAVDDLRRISLAE